MGNLSHRAVDRLVILLTTVCLTLTVLERHAEARAGGSSSAGSRGSRSYQAPARRSQTAPPVQPTREASQPLPQTVPVAPQPGGFMRGLAGSLLGGFLGAMLFSGFAGGGWGGIGGSGIGLIEILLLVGLGYFIYSMMRRPALEPNYGDMEYQSAGYPLAYDNTMPETTAADQPDFSPIRMLDRDFDPAQFIKTGQDIFFKLQMAWSRLDIATVNSLCAPELARSWERELMDLRNQGRRNCIENIALRNTEITEAWTEQGEDYITVHVEANLEDFTIDEKSGITVAGSKSDLVDFEEFWTFPRPVGPNPWKLTAVQQP